MCDLIFILCFITFCIRHVTLTICGVHECAHLYLSVHTRNKRGPHCTCAHRKVVYWFYTVTAREQFWSFQFICVSNRMKFSLPEAKWSNNSINNCIKRKWKCCMILGWHSSIQTMNTLVDNKIIIREQEI